MIEYFLVFFVVLAASYFVAGKRNRRNKPSHPSPPSLPSLPIVGSLPFLRDFDNIANFFMKTSHKLGPIFTFRVGSKLALTLNNKEAIEEALVKNSRSFSGRPEIFMQKLINPFSKGIGFMDTSPEWKRIHKNSLSILREFGFGDKSAMEERILREVGAMIDYGRNTRGKSFDPNELSSLMTSNIITNILFASRQCYDLGTPELITESDRYAHLMDLIFDVAPFIKFIPPFSEKISAIKTCGKKIYNIIDAEIEKSLKSHEKCFVSEYLKKEGSDYDRDQLNFLLRDMIAAGTDTTANTFRWSLVAFANHPEIQKKLQEEIDSVIPRDRLPTLQDQSKLHYMEATILELYRWRTIVPLSVLRYTQYDAIVKDFFIPRGTLVFPNLYAAHSDPMVWIDPDVFRPERFLDNEGNVVGTERVIPFSLGRRSCLGEMLARAEIFLILTSFLQRFTVLPPEGQDRICDKPSLPVDIILVPRSFSVRLMARY